MTQQSDQSELPDHLALASQWALEADDWVRSARYEERIDGDLIPGEANQRHIYFMHQMAQMHALVAQAQASSRHNQTINVSVPGGSVEVDGGVRGVATPGEGA